MGEQNPSEDLTMREYLAEPQQEPIEEVSEQQVVPELEEQVPQEEVSEQQVVPELEEQVPLPENPVPVSEELAQDEPAEEPVQEPESVEESKAGLNVEEPKVETPVE